MTCATRLQVAHGRIGPRRVCRPWAVVSSPADRVVREALTDTRVLLVNGARPSGKSTLVGQVGDNLGAGGQTLDPGRRPGMRPASISEFVAAEQLIIIDEIQREPKLLLAIKERVDRDRRPGQFLLAARHTS